MPWLVLLSSLAFGVDPELPIKAAEAEYPASMVLIGANELVWRCVVEVDVDAKGKPVEARVLECPTPFAKSTVKAAMRSRWSKEGGPTRTFEVHFTKEWWPSADELLAIVPPAIETPSTHLFPKGESTGHVRDAGVCLPSYRQGDQEVWVATCGREVPQGALRCAVLAEAGAQWRVVAEACSLETPDGKTHSAERPRKDETVLTRIVQDEDVTVWGKLVPLGLEGVELSRYRGTWLSQRLIWAPAGQACANVQIAAKPHVPRDSCDTLGAILLESHR